MLRKWKGRPYFDAASLPAAILQLIVERGVPQGHFIELNQPDR